MRWGTLFPAVYVNILYSAVKTHLSPPFRFICFTDEPSGLHPDIEVRPIPDLGLPQQAWATGAWPKIGVFAKEAFDFEGRALFIDLDTMINGDLALFCDGKDTFQAIGPKSWTKRRAKHPAVYRWLKPKIRALEHKLGLAPPRCRAPASIWKLLRRIWEPEFLPLISGHIPTSWTLCVRTFLARCVYIVTNNILCRTI
jgi:hypothetical protein